MLGMPHPKPPIWQRLWFIIAVVVVMLVGIVVIIWAPWRSPCGAGLTDVESPYYCVGLDLNSTALQEPDPLADLESKIARDNAKITGDFGAIVLLDNFTANPNTDSVSVPELRHRIEGANTAVWRANNQAVAGGTTPKIKLLLASFGGGAKYESQAVQSIIQARKSQHIVAVTGFGQSLDQTRQAAKDLSDANIVSVGSVVTSDDMNRDLTGKRIPNFFRVAATNTGTAIASVSYIASHKYQKVLLVKDTNQEDSYAQTLASAFGTAFASQYRFAVPYTEPYQSPDTSVTGATRDTYMTNQFAHMHGDICADRPDLVYFAGRGVDLGSFLKALSQGGACGLGPIDVMTGDDAASIVGRSLPPFPDLHVRVLFTALATAGQWGNFPPDAEMVQNYDQFAQAFSNRDNGFDPGDLVEEDAIMSYDAVLAATTAARIDPLATTDPSTVTAYFLRLRCTQFVPGASGDIAFDSSGNSVDKAVPLLQLHPNGSAVQQDLTWPTGKQFNPSTTC
ncbi:MAG TPA: amino acid ABC transporter substrate-binding protein [Pseudonocardiaceae bacterium]|jgi:ABC-type branched-subunit amino acid transport system substrate-binding protein